MTGLGVGPRVVDRMDGREIHDLMRYWKEHPPAHIASAQTRDVIIAAFGGKRDGPSKSATIHTPEELAASLGLSLGPDHG